MNYTLEYEIPIKDDYDIFDYDVDEAEAEEYILRTYSYPDIIEIFTDDIFYTLSDKEKENLKVFNYDGTYESIFSRMNEEDLEDMVNEILYTMIDKGIFDDELKDYFEDEALEAYYDTH